MLKECIQNHASGKSQRLNPRVCNAHTCLITARGTEGQIRSSLGSEADSLQHPDTTTAGVGPCVSFLGLLLPVTTHWVV